jgi:pilus assembly protein CpaF
VAELVTDPRELVRVRVERALAAEEVNLASEQGRARAQTLIEEVLRAYEADALNGQERELTGDEREQLARELRDDLIGLGAIAERMLADPFAQEWMINGPKRVFRDTGERIERVPELTFHDDRQVRSFLERLLEQVEGKRLDRITPRVEARLPDGSRLTAAIPPISSNGHPICTIRRFRLGAGALAELVELNFLSEEAAAFLTACVRAGKNLIVAGRVSSGKTTLLNALGRAIPGSERIVVCESSAELQLPAILPNCVGYEARPASPDGLPGVTLEDLVADALRMNPDRILVGECRGPETMAMLWAFATGHAGMTSVHGESAEHALRNLIRFALTSGARVETEQALDWLREIDVVVHCDRPRSFDGGERRFLPRRIDEIAEVAGVEGSRLTLNPLFEGAGPKLRWVGSEPAFTADLARAGFEPPR